MTTNPASTEVFTPRLTDGHISLHEQLLTSLSSLESQGLDSIEASLPPSPHPQKFREKIHVQFAQPSIPQNNSCRGRIKVDEIDDAAHPVGERRPTRSSRSRSRSVLRGIGGPRSASRPARRRALSRGPISRETTSDQLDDPAMTLEQIARELRPESFTRFRRITLSDSKNDVSTDKIDTPTPGQIRDFDFEKEAKAMREKFQQMNSPGSLSPGEEMDPDALNITCIQGIKLPETEAFNLEVYGEHQMEKN